jgi:serine/threonine-protein kinase
MGTVPYMAPELIDPATWGRAEGPARDLFAFGVMAWEVLFRRHPTGLGPNASMIDHARAYKAAQAGVIRWPPHGLDGAWGAAVGACLALRPADRPANGAELLRLLRATAAPGARSPATRAALSATTEQHRPPTRSALAPRPAGRLLRWAGVAVVFVLSLVSVAATLVSTGWFEGLLPWRRAPVTPPPGSARAPVVTPAPSAPAPVVSALGACCPTERTKCTGPSHFDCPPCPGPRARIPLGASWSLRVEDVRSGKDDLVKTRPGAALTMRLGEATAELPLAWISAKRAGDAPLRVTTEDIEGRRIHFTLVDGETTLADGNGHVDASKGPEVLVSALCAGLVLYVDRPDGAPITLSVFLDP